MSLTIFNGMTATELELTSLDGDGICIERHFKFQRDKYFNLSNGMNRRLTRNLIYFYFVYFYFYFHSNLTSTVFLYQSHFVLFLKIL